MSNSNGIISAPIGVDEVAQVLGVTVKDVGYLCSNAHGKTNRYSWVKPEDEPSIAPISQTSALNYVKHLRLKTYTIGDPVPTIALADYDAPKGGVSSPYRLTDFDGYSHYEYPHTADLSVISGTTIDTDNPGKSFPISYRHDSGVALFQYLVNGENIKKNGNTSGMKYWYYGILIIAKYGTSTMYYLSHRSFPTASTLTIPSLSATAGIRKELIDIDITKYTCTILAVAWLYDSVIDLGINPNSINKLSASSGYTFTILPQVNSINPIATNVKFTRPKDRVDLTVVIVDITGRDSYLPQDYSISSYMTIQAGGQTTHPSLNNNLFDDMTKEFFTSGYEDQPLIYGKRGWVLFSNNYYVDSNPLTVSLQVIAGKDGQRVLDYSGNFDKATDDGLGVEFKWDVNLKNHINEHVYLILGLAIHDDNYRDD